MAIICHCNAVRERTIVKAIHRGAATVDELKAQCGAADACGGCEGALAQLLQQHAADQRRPTADPRRHTRPRLDWAT
jgi:NAD(P)H-nitrite reductase large subunit